MATAPKTRLVRYFSPGLGFLIDSGNIIYHHGNGGEFPLYRPLYPRRKMTHSAMNLVMRRFFPRSEIRFHIMTNDTKSRLRGGFYEKNQGDPNQNAKYQSH
jgi:hypothetical protein